MNKTHPTSHTLLARRAWQKSTTGMTLIEVVVTLAVAALIMVSASDAALSFYRANSEGGRAVSQLGSARYALASFLQDARGAAYGDDGSYPISSMSTSSILFFSNMLDSGSALRINYQLSGTTLIRSQVAPGTPASYAGTPITSNVATNVHNNASGVPLFRYYDANGIEISDMSRVEDVASVLMAIEVLAPGMSQPFKLNARVTPRNLRGI